MTRLLVDAGPMVAYALANERDHAWVAEQFSSLTNPVFTCEAALVEASYLLGERGASREYLWAFLRSGLLQIAFDLESEFESVAALMGRYSDIPMDLADACLVRMSELHRDCRVWTLDRDFRFYRRFGRQVIPLLAPF